MVPDLRHILSFLLLAAMLTLPTTSLLAQDSHFWDSQFGTRSQLLGGIVVGAPNDLSTTYYNPAWLAMENKPSVLLTTKTFEAYNLTAENNFNNGSDPTSTQVTPSPGFFGIQFSQNTEDDELSIAFSYLQKVKFDFKASGIQIDENPAPPEEGNFWFSGEAFKITSVSEYWAGVTFAKQIGDHTLAGITPFGALRNQSMRNQVSAKGMGSDENFSHIYSMDYSDFWHIRLLLKAGLAFDYSPLTFGVTLTTPSVGVIGEGSVYQDGSLSGIDIFDPEGTPDTFMAVNHQPGLSPNFKSPLSIAAGAAYKLGDTRLYVSAEWFNTLGKYDIMSPDSFSSQSHPNYIFTYDISYSTRSIINWGIAGSHNFSSRVAMYLSFWSDKSNLNQSDDPNMMMALWNLKHTNVGASFEFMNIEFTTGLGFSYGNGTSHHFATYTTDNEEGLEGKFPPTEVTFKRIKFLIGFNLPFGQE